MDGLPFAVEAELLQESAEDLYENAPCGYLSALPDGTIVKLNQTFLAWTGYRRDELVGRRRFQDLLTAGGRIYHETHYAPLLRMQGWVREIAVEIVRADGSRLPALINTVLKYDPAGQPLLARTTVFDATDRREYERELLRQRRKAQEADQAKADFISTVSHEIRNPVSSILGIAELLGLKGRLEPQQQELVRLLRLSSENLLSLINDILDFSKIEAGKSSLEKRSFDLRRVVSGVVEPLQLEAQAKGITLASRVDERVPESLLGDPIKIGQVLTNLVANAVKFTAEGTVTVEVRVLELTPEAASIEFRVTDTGIGISPQQLPHVFDDFSQASYDIGLKYGGTGLGLAISKKLVELQGGQIAVDSELGRGTAFSFVLRLNIEPLNIRT
jgi:PAS domain S-box-containing protein